MSSFFVAIFLAIVALSTSASPPEQPIGQHVLARFYSDFTQLYRPAVPQPLAMDNNEDKSIETYQFFFTKKEFSYIAEDSLTMLHTNVIDRTITYIPEPNFQVPGTRYFYRRDAKDNDAIEIELVNGENRLFREVRRPDRYFYLSSFEELEYVQRPPMMPHYRVTFVCNTSVNAPQTIKPRLSYLDRTLRWTPRYLLDVPIVQEGRQAEFSAFADIRNYGEQSIIVQGAEFMTGSVRLNERSAGVCSRRSVLLATDRFTFIASVPVERRPLDESSNGRRSFPVAVQSPMTIPPRSTKSVRFMQPKVEVRPFSYFTNSFSMENSTGRVFNAYNVTSMNGFLPRGRLLLREGGQFMGEINLPNLMFNETAMMLFGYDADVSYRRQVRLMENESSNNTDVYQVEYLFENVKPSRDVRLYFTESFDTLQSFEVKNITPSLMREQEQFEMNFDGNLLRGFIPLRRQEGRSMFTYTLRMSRPKLMSKFLGL